MTFRQETDRRLVLISEAQLNDEEYAALTVPASPTTEDYYAACTSVIAMRGDIGNANERLQALALALDNIVYGATATVESNIFIGAELEN
jgi:hypothetical protein